MKIMIMFFSLLLYFLFFKVEGFIPAKFMNTVINRLNKNFHDNFGEISKTLVHEEILKRGIVQSVAKYFYDQPDGNDRVNLTKFTEIYDLKILYQDYYGQKFCDRDIKLNKLLKDVFDPNVAKIDFQSSTKKMPYAHFDSETFIQSNRRVINYKNLITNSINMSDYKMARIYSAQILHTIQDFYSHSNWVEMGNHKKINADIGTIKFELKEPVVDKNTKACFDNCTLIEVKCTRFVSILWSIIKFFGINSSLIKCPLRYYKCDNNIKELGKLVSGYSVNQKLPDGTPIEKPIGKMKCSHGGVMDGSSFVEAYGGINKDSGYYLFSPRADLHLIAAQLAVQHTEYFFNELRSEIGDESYVEFFELKLDHGLFTKFQQYTGICL